LRSPRTVRHRTDVAVTAVTGGHRAPHRRCGHRAPTLRSPTLRSPAVTAPRSRCVDDRRCAAPSTFCDLAMSPTLTLRTHCVPALRGSLGLAWCAGSARSRGGARAASTGAVGARMRREPLVVRRRGRARKARSVRRVISGDRCRLGTRRCGVLPVSWLRCTGSACARTPRERP